MKAVILGKSNSKRILQKNYKIFFEDQSLTDILIKKLLKVMDGQDIFLSCEDEKYRCVADKWNIQFIHRDVKYTLLETNTVDVVRGVCKDVPGDDDILYCSGMDPLFDDYENMFRIWKEVREQYDSLNVIYPKKNYVLDQNYQPINFVFGRWHSYSQYIAPTYQVSWANEILTRQCIDLCGYMVGEKPFWYYADGPMVDIDTEKDWEIAQVIYQYYNQKNNRN